MRTKFRYGVPVAEAVRFFVCDACDYVHFAMIGPGEQAIAMASLTPEDAESLFAELIVAIKQARDRREAPSH